MIITPQGSPFNMVAIRETFTNEELSLIWKELDFLTREDVLLPPSGTGASFDENKDDWKKSNSGIFLHDIYAKRSISPISNFSEKVITSPEVMEAMIKCSSVNELIKNINQRSVLVSYYEDNDYYDSHKDSCAYTAVTYLHKEPKAFDGGEITFFIGESFITFEPENNMTVLFPSCYDHEVGKVEMRNGRHLSTYGRYAISQFLGIGFVNS